MPILHTIRVITKDPKDDIKASGVYFEARTTSGITNLEKVRTVKVYRVEGITIEEAKTLAEKLFCESINQSYSIDKPLIQGATEIIEISYKPGVMNPEVASIIKAANDMDIHLVAVDSSYEYGFYGDITKKDIETITQKQNLLNPTVEYIVEKEPQTLIIKGKPGKTKIIPIRSLNDKKLMKLSQDKLFLNLEEMKVIQNYFKKIRRNPTDCELETLAQTWSEHCAHKTFKAKLKINGKNKEPLITRLKKEASKHNKYTVSAFIDNSGVMDFYDDYAICGKVETHNSPSAIEPYGGAMTGSGGVFRDVLGTGLGAKTIASTDIFCFAPFDMDSSFLPPGCLPPEYLLKRVIAGVKDYGNRMGIPTNNGSLHFHDDFRAKPTVLVGAYGIIKKKKARIGKVRHGDIVVAVGGKTGRDGIHGATFSSGEMTDKTITVNSSAVQIGNAIEEKRMSDCLLKATDENLIQAIQDCGAGGFSSAIGEMGEKTGVKIDIKQASLKYQGLSPWEIWVSESQERMIVAVSKKKLKRFLTLCKTYNVETAILGKFDGSRKLRVLYGKKIVCNLDMQFLHHGLPQRTMIAKKHTSVMLERSDSIFAWDSITPPKAGFQNDILEPKTENEWISVLTKILSHGNIASKEPIVRLYDHSVQGTNSLQPYLGVNMDGPQNASVIRPLLDKKYGMIIAHGLNPILNRIDPYWGSVWAAIEGLSNYVAVGGDYKQASLINNYSWPFPDNESVVSLDQSVDAVCDLMKLFHIPVISGKDSLSSTYRKNDLVIKIPPVLCISVFGKIPDVSKTVTSDFKKENSLIVLIGNLDTDSMGGSIYFDVNKILGNKVPKPNLKKLPRIFSSLYKAIQKNALLSCHDISEGGLFTTLFEMCIGGNLGTTIDISKLTSKVDRPDFILFNETPGCFLVEVKNREVLLKYFKNIPYVILGKTEKKPTIAVEYNKKILFEQQLEKLKEIWQEPMKRIFS